VCKRTPKSFDLLKIWAKSLKIWAEMAPNICRKTTECHILEVTPKNGPQKLEDNFLGKFGKIWAKILCTPTHWLAPIPMIEPNGLESRLYAWMFCAETPYQSLGGKTEISIALCHSI